MSGSFARKQVKIAEEAVARGTREPGATGTVQSVDPTAMTARVVLQDGSSNPIGAMVPVHIPCLETDRVALQRYGNYWVIVALLGVVRGLGFGAVSQAATSASAPVGSWGNLPGTPAFQFRKMWTATRVLWRVNASLFGTNGVTYQFGVTYNSGSTTVKVGDKRFANTAGSATVYDEMFSHEAPESGLAAGLYTVRLRWQADGVASVTGDDWFSGSGVEYV